MVAAPEEEEEGHMSGGCMGSFVPAQHTCWVGMRSGLDDTVEVALPREEEMWEAEIHGAALLVLGNYLVAVFGVIGRTTLDGLHSHLYLVEVGTDILHIQQMPGEAVVGVVWVWDIRHIGEAHTLVCPVDFAHG